MIGRQWRLTWRKAGPVLSVVLLVALVVVPIGLLLWLIFYTDIFNIQAITVVDARKETTDEIRVMVEQELMAHPSRSLFFVEPGVIENKILTKFTYVRSVQARRQLPGTLRVVIQEKDPALLLLVNNRYYFVDSEGLAYEEARLDTLPGLILPTVKDRNPDSQVILGTPVLSESFVRFVQTVEGELPNKIEAEVVEVLIPSLAAREVQFQLDNNWKIRFDVTRSAEGQLTLLQELVNSTISVEERAALDYVDLRIPKRIYYKTRFNDSPQTAE